MENYITSSTEYKKYYSDLLKAIKKIHLDYKIQLKYSEIKRVQTLSSSIGLSLDHCKSTISILNGYLSSQYPEVRNIAAIALIKHLEHFQKILFKEIILRFALTGKVDQKFIEDNAGFASNICNNLIKKSFSGDINLSTIKLFKIKDIKNNMDFLLRNKRDSRKIVLFALNNLFDKKDQNPTIPQPINADEKIKVLADIQVILSRLASAFDGPENKLAEPPIPPIPSPLAEWSNTKTAVAIPLKI